jgi:hypothetical protein
LKKWIVISSLLPRLFSSSFKTGRKCSVSMVSMGLSVLRGQQMCFSDNSPPQEASIEGSKRVQNGKFARNKLHYIQHCTPCNERFECLCADISAEIPAIHDIVTQDGCSAQQGSIYSGIAAKIFSNCKREHHRKLANHLHFAQQYFRSL